MTFQSGAIFTERPTDYSLEKAHELLGSIQIVPPSISIPVIPQVWQSKYPACGAHALAHAIELFELEENNVTTKLSPAYAWKQIKKIDGYKPEVGTDMYSIFRVARDKGTCTYDLLPNDYTQSLTQYTDASVITPLMDDDANPRIISSYAFCTDLSMENLKRMIFINKAVLLLLRCDDGFFGTGRPTFTTKKYGHFVTAVAYDAMGLWVIDSTETNYPYKFIANQYAPFIQQAGTMIDLPDYVIKNLKTKISLMQQIVALLKRLKLMK